MPLKSRARTVYRLTRMMALIDLVFLCGYFGALIYGGDHLDFFDPANDWLFLTLQVLGVIGILGTVVPAYEFWIALFDRARPWWTKVTDFLILCAALATIWFALTLNFVNFHLNY